MRKIDSASDCGKQLSHEFFQHEAFIIAAQLPTADARWVSKASLLPTVSALALPQGIDDPVMGSKGGSMTLPQAPLTVLSPAVSR